MHWLAMEKRFISAKRSKVCHTVKKTTSKGATTTIKQSAFTEEISRVCEAVKENAGKV